MRFVMHTTSCADCICGIACGVQMLVEFFGVEPGFPLTTHLITRSLETAFPKRLYFVSAPAPFSTALTGSIHAHAAQDVLS
jgi:hypothetical protein